MKNTYLLRCFDKTGFGEFPFTYFLPAYFSKFQPNSAVKSSFRSLLRELNIEQFYRSGNYISSTTQCKIWFYWYCTGAGCATYRKLHNHTVYLWKTWLAYWIICKSRRDSFYYICTLFIAIGFLSMVYQESKDMQKQLGRNVRNKAFSGLVQF